MELHGFSTIFVPYGKSNMNKFLMPLSLKYCVLHPKVEHLEPWEKGSRKTAGQVGMCGGVSVYHLLYLYWMINMMIWLHSSKAEQEANEPS